MFRFKCATCDAWHEGMPTYGADAPRSYYAIPEDEREARCSRESDWCVIDAERFFIRGCLDIPVHGEADPFSWGVWVCVSPDDFKEYARTYEHANCSHIAPFSGLLDALLPLYPSTANLKTMVHLRNDNARPYIEVVATDHPLAMEQREGISVARVAEICAHFAHRVN